MSTTDIQGLGVRLQRINRDLNRAGRNAQGLVMKQFVASVTKMRNTAIKSMRNTTKVTDRFYTRGGRRHFPSAPGSPPAIDSGNLVASIRWDVRRNSVEFGSIITEPAYPAFLEHGSDDGSLEARPWLEPAVAEHVDEMVDEIGAESFDIIVSAFDDNL